jgi:hypothetical protein
VSSVSPNLEAAAVVTDGPDPDADADTDLAAVRDLAGGDIAVFVADPAGSVRRVVRT